MGTKYQQSIVKVIVCQFRFQIAVTDGQASNICSIIYYTYIPTYVSYKKCCEKCQTITVDDQKLMLIYFKTIKNFVQRHSAPLLHQCLSQYFLLLRFCYMIEYLTILCNNVLLFFVSLPVWMSNFFCSCPFANSFEQNLKDLLEIIPILQSKYWETKIASERTFLTHTHTHKPIK